MRGHENTVYISPEAHLLVLLASAFQFLSGHYLRWLFYNISVIPYICHSSQLGQIGSRHSATEQREADRDKRQMILHR